MLRPEIKLTNERHICSCGAPNFRYVDEFHKRLYNIYEVSIPKGQFYKSVHYLCEDCLATFAETKSQKPLTIAELKERDGGAVWIIDNNNPRWNGWYLVNNEDDGFVIDKHGWKIPFRCLGKGRLAYGNKPISIVGHVKAGAMEE